jgi:prostaglandin-E synthase
LWAQREDCLYVTINVSDLTDEKVTLNETALQFTATRSDGKQFTVDLQFYAEVDPANSKYANCGRNYAFVIQKAASGPYWPRLLKDTAKQRWLKTDFAKWRDEDEEEDVPDPMANNPFGGMDMSQFGGMGGMGGMDMSQFGGMGGAGGMDFSGMGGDAPMDSDDEEVEEGEQQQGENAAAAFQEKLAQLQQQEGVQVAEAKEQ